MAQGSPSSDWPDVGGRYPLSASDVRQILAIVRPRADIRKPISRIEVWRHDEAEVHGGDGQNQTFVRLTRTHGKWSVVSVVEETRVSLGER